MRSQASKYENGLASSAAAAEENARDKDRRMSLQNQGGNTASIGKRGFMSRLRAAGGSVSGAHAFHPPSSATALSTSGSWSMVDPPTPMKEQSSATNSSRIVHLAFTTLATQAAPSRAGGLVGRASPSLLLTTTPGSTDPTETLHSTRLDVAGLSHLISSTKPDAVYVGSARSTSGNEALRPYVESLLSPSSTSLKLILFEPAAARQLTPSDASALHNLARTRSISLLLPIRWASLWTASIDETLLGLEILHDLHEEDDAALASRAAAATDGDARVDSDTSVDKSFDVSMSNIPTGLSGDGLSKVAEVEALKTQMEQLRSELERRDARIGELTKQAEEQVQQQQQQRAGLEEVERLVGAHTSAAVEPKTPSRLPVVVSSEAVTPAAQMQSELKPSSDTDQAAVPARASPAADSAASALLPMPSTSEQLAAAAASPSDSPTNAATGMLAPAARITPGKPGPSRPLASAELGSMSPNSARSSGKVISALTAELAETKLLLDATRQALTTVKTQCASYQAAADEMRSTLSRARLENDSSVTILARKDRQISEALERARKAEAEAKELGRASREWGTRIREVEEELGKERMRRSRAEQQYDALGTEWKTVRTSMVDQVRALREEHSLAMQHLKNEVDDLRTFKQRLLVTTSTADPAESLAPCNLVAQITDLNSQMCAYLDAQLQPLRSQLDAFEQRESHHITDKLQYLTDELTRIKTLMRRAPPPS